MTNCYRRTLEDAQAILTYAKQNESEIIPVTQVFYHPSQNECIEAKKNWKLMDIDEEFIQLLEDGDRGSDQEKVVLCTEDQTFEVKEGEISNSLVVCPNLLYSCDVKSAVGNKPILKDQKVCGIYNNYFELRLTFPRFKKLQSLLLSTAYQGSEKGDNIHTGFYFSELLDTVQCSRSELIQHLKEIKALCIDGKWRILDLEYETRALSYLVSLMEDQKWMNIHGKDAKRILKPLLPTIIIEHILKFYTTPLETNSDLYSFKEDKVSQCFAEMLLKTAEGKFRHNEFMMAWEQCLPRGVYFAIGVKPDLKYLKGLALVEKEGIRQEVVHLFPEYNLPENISERFRLLFKRKEKWTLDEITPYLEKLATKNMNVNTMLTKYARASNSNNTRVFGARYAN